MDQLVERPHIRRLSGVATPLRHHLITPSQTDKLVEGLYAVADANGRPLSFFMTARQVRDYTGAAALLGDMPTARWLLGDRGHDTDWFRDALHAKGIQPCMSGRKSRNEAVRYDKRRYRRRSRIEIIFGRLRDWRRAATRDDRCPTAFFTAIHFAATVIFWR